MEQVGALRKCKGEYYQNGVFAPFETGHFHEWGLEYEEFDNGAVSYTVAIVELPSGKIVTVMPRNIQFINKK